MIPKGSLRKQGAFSFSFDSQTNLINIMGYAVCTLKIQFMKVNMMDILVFQIFQKINFSFNYSYAFIQNAR